MSRMLCASCYRARYLWSGAHRNQVSSFQSGVGDFSHCSGPVAVQNARGGSGRGSKEGLTEMSNFSIANKASSDTITKIAYPLWF